VNEANRPIGKGAASAHRPRVSVVIPALNEARNLPHVAARLPAGVDEIVFVDGDSVDGTAEVARSLWPDAIHLRQTRKGKGNALSCGFAAATGDIIVMIDADGSTDPAEIPAFVGLLQAGAGLECHAQRRPVVESAFPLHAVSAGMKLQLSTMVAVFGPHAADQAKVIRLLSKVRPPIADFQARLAMLLKSNLKWVNLVTDKTIIGIERHDSLVRQER